MFLTLKYLFFLSGWRTALSLTNNLYYSCALRGLLKDSLKVSYPLATI